MTVSYSHIIDLDGPEVGTFAGVPIVTTEALQRGQIVTLPDLNGRAWSIHMHPVTAHALSLQAVGNRQPGIHLQLDAELAWIHDKIKARARAAEIKLDRRVIAGRDRQAARAEAFDHPSQHAMYYDRLRCASYCHECPYSITDETARRLGLRVAL